MSATETVLLKLMDPSPLIPDINFDCTVNYLCITMNYVQQNMAESLGCLLIRILFKMSDTSETFSNLSSKLANENLLKR